MIAGPRLMNNRGPKRAASLSMARSRCFHPTMVTLSIASLLVNPGRPFGAWPLWPRSPGAAEYRLERG